MELNKTNNSKMMKQTFQAALLLLAGVEAADLNFVALSPNAPTLSHATLQSKGYLLVENGYECNSTQNYIDRNHSNRTWFPVPKGYTDMEAVRLCEDWCDNYGCKRFVYQHKTSGD